MGKYNNFVNRYQGDYKKVLCVCTAGLLRSPTAAWVLSNDPYNYNTRACGIEKKYALIHLNEGLIFWANEIVCMNNDIYEELNFLYPTQIESKQTLNLDIPDNFAYRDEKLIEMIKEKYNAYTQRS